MTNRRQAGHCVGNVWHPSLGTTEPRRTPWRRPPSQRRLLPATRRWPVPEEVHQLAGRWGRIRGIARQSLDDVRRFCLEALLPSPETPETWLEALVDHIPPPEGQWTETLVGQGTQPQPQPRATTKKVRRSWRRQKNLDMAQPQPRKAKPKTNDRTRRVVVVTGDHTRGRGPAPPPPCPPGTLRAHSHHRPTTTPRYWRARFLQSNPTNPCRRRHLFPSPLRACSLSTIYLPGNLSPICTYHSRRTCQLLRSMVCSCLRLVNYGRGSAHLKTGVFGHFCLQTEKNHR